MVLESTVICVDNSDYMRNGDFIPTRIQAQQDAVNLVCQSKTRSNPESNIALVSMADTIEVLSTLTTDAGKVLAKLHQVEVNGLINVVSAVRIAHLVLKHRQGRNHKLRIIVFVGSPVDAEKPDLVRLAKRLKKEKVACDIINFGEEAINTEKLTTFMETINGKEGTSSHLLTVPPGPLLSDALVSSAIIAGEDGSGAIDPASAMGGIDPAEDPELALALRMSMEEQRQRTGAMDVDPAAGPPEAGTSGAPGGGTENQTDEDAMLQQALQQSMGGSAFPSNFSAMSEEEQLELAIRMSMAESAAAMSESSGAAKADAAGPSIAPPPYTETEAPAAEKAAANEDDVEMGDADFLRDVLENIEKDEGGKQKDADKKDK